MKIKQILLGLSLVFAATYAQAQVKVGSNPGTIGSSSNLEVEATNGNKTMVDKATGQVTIVDGTQGAGKVFTSDANGGGSWKSTGGQTGSGFDSYLTPSAAFNITATNPATIVYPFPDVTITEAGTYMAIVRTFGSVPNANATVAFYSNIRKNGSSAGQDSFEWYAAVGNNAVFGVTGNLFFTANAGDVVTVGFTSGYAANNPITVSSGFLPRNNVRFVKVR